MKKRFLAFVLAMIMVIGLLPTTVFAENYNGTLNTDYGKLTYETGAQKGVKVTIFVNGTQKKQYVCDDFQLVANSTAFKVSEGYHIIDVKTNDLTWGLVTGHLTSTEKTGTLTLDNALTSHNWEIKIYLGTPYTVTVNYAYTDKSPDNSKIKTYSSYCDRYICCEVGS